MIYRFLVDTIWVVALLIIFIIFLYVTDTPKVSFHNVPFPVEEKVLKPGGVLKFTIEVCAHDEVTYRFTQKLVNKKTGEEFFLPSQEATSVKGCNTITSIPKMLPDYLTDGDYYLSGTALVPGYLRQHNINGLRSDLFVIQSN